ncbi:glycosyl hydrolase 2 galactose-binding domain-containing protein [Paenibacillus macerans]|uniref:beta-mannosidase n=1 Tax=Paenibacillus macerans TaxID=44252 RepID=UPI00203E027D|nr:glycoside hydrolase family 2 protein [Paenibacillus macerans]MCM3701718.1 glycoside hydrolase family 2 protein [Paenibacillus macerans]
MNNQRYVLSDWKFKACDETKWLPARVPGTVHTDLLRCGAIPDPFYGTNEHELQWIDKKDWEYQTSFELNEAWAKLPRIEIVFEGLDTYADVFVNGLHVFLADNMFRCWRADIKPLLREGLNTIAVRFRSPIAEDLPKLERLGYDLPAANDQSELGGLGDRRVSVFARKAPYHYGWDWGPRLVTSGIWREARIEAWSGLVLRDLFIRQDRVAPEAAELTAIVEIEAAAEWEGRVRVSAGESVWERQVALKPGVQVVELPLALAQPKLWWCRGLGEPAMHTFKAELVGASGIVEADAAVRTGLREIKLVREKDEAGASFRFELNGVHVFTKGANHIPNDSFITEVTAERYRHEIASAAESGMNMLRVWGGGIYEQDVFYELCDEYGLLVWQDFMFACSMYPGDAAFLENVAREAEHNIKRLRNHPCIALWCGNNEIDSAWSHYVENAGWGWKENYTADVRERIWADYEAVFHDILPRAVERLAGGVTYWPSSPLRDLTGDTDQHAYKVSGEGDIHYWGVWHAVEPFANYNTRIGRFMSEYGFQSFPELDSVLKYAPESALELESDIMLAHQKNGRGNQLIKEYMDIYLPAPRDFKAFLYMSQVLQAEAIRTAIEAHRRNKPYCMGTLYWQMNDCWPVASWAGMDYYGRWKALQYAVRRSFRDVMLSVFEPEDGKIAVSIVSDKRENVSGTLRLTLYDVRGGVLKETVQVVEIAADSAREAVSFARESWLENHDPRQVILLASLELNGEVADSKPFYFVSGKDLVLPQAQIEVREVPGSGGGKYTLVSGVLAQQVWIQAEREGIFSDNYFDLMPGVPVTVEFRLRGSAADDEAFIPGAPGEIRVRSMADFV